MSDNKLQKGIAAVNQDFKKYEQVDKLQRYRLSEGADEVFDETYELQVCDLEMLMHGTPQEKEQFVQDLGTSLEEIGFAVLTGHGVDPALYEEATTTTARLFESYPYQDKMKYRAQRHGSVNQGYFPMKETTIIHPDMVEGWVFCRRAFNMEGNKNFNSSDFWPNSTYEETFRKVVIEHEKLILPLMRSILTYLGEDPHLYDQKLTRTNFGFRLNYYPAIQHLSEARGGRLLGHEDVDLFTILPASRIEGLQALHRGTMKWIRINAPENSIILNTGDYMQRITNDRLPSTTHRVSNPRNPDLFKEPRITFPMAVYVWEDEMLEGLPALGQPKYPPVRAETFHTRITSKYYGDDYAEEK